MTDRRKAPRPDRLFVDSTITGDVETIALSTKPGELGPPIVRVPPPAAPVVIASDLGPAPVKGDEIFLGDLLPAEEIQREPDPYRRQRDPLTVAGAVALVLLIVGYTFGPLIVAVMQ